MKGRNKKKEEGALSAMARLVGGGWPPLTRPLARRAYSVVQGSQFWGISLISGKSEVPFQGNSLSFSEKDVYVHPKILSKSIFLAPDYTKLISR